MELCKSAALEEKLSPMRWSRISESRDLDMEEMMACSARSSSARAPRP